MRARIVAEMRAHRERYVDFAEQWDVPGGGEARHGNSWAEFVSAMEVKGEWGGNTTLLAAANAYGRVLHVVSAPASTAATRSFHTAIAPVLMVGGSEGEDIWLAYLNGDHYRATALLDGYATVHDIQFPSDVVNKTLKELVALKALQRQFATKETGGGTGFEAVQPRVDTPRAATTPVLAKVDPSRVGVGAIGADESSGLVDNVRQSHSSPLVDSPRMSQWGWRSTRHCPDSKIANSAVLSRAMRFR